MGGSGVDRHQHAVDGRRTVDAVPGSGRHAEVRAGRRRVYRRHREPLAPNAFIGGARLCQEAFHAGDLARGAGARVGRSLCRITNGMRCWWQPPGKFWKPCSSRVFTVPRRQAPPQPCREELMPDNEWDEMLVAATGEVLETM